MRGEPVFTPEELLNVYPIIPSFFEDGISREIVVLDKTIIRDVSKAGKEYTRVEWKLADAHSGEEKTFKFDFGLTNAFHDHKNVMRMETSKFRITPQKTGERNGYDTFDYSIEYLGESGGDSVSVTNDKKEIPLSDIPFK